MRIRYCNDAQPALFKRLLTVLSCLVVATIGGCDERSSSDGVVITTIVLPTDTLLNLNCIDVGIFTEQCVLDDPENPYLTVPIAEFDENNPDAETKFDLADQIPAGPTGAKARFYLWTTALARRSSGENQWLVAQALHELYDANSDPIVQEQALKAYRSVLDNYFGSVIFFSCCANLDPNGEPIPFSVPLNELTADNLFRTDSTPWVRLVPGDPLLALSLMAEWGYSYQPATPPNFDNGVVSVNDG